MTLPRVWSRPGTPGQCRVVRIRGGTARGRASGRVLDTLVACGLEPVSRAPAFVTLTEAGELRTRRQIFATVRFAGPVLEGDVGGR